MPHPIQWRWEETKWKLAEAITGGADFKPWPKGGRRVYSVRLNKNYRAHIRRPEVGDTPWTALDIGTHTKMGHG